MPDACLPLPPELVAFAEGGVSLLVGTCSLERVPDCVRGMGVKVAAGGCDLTVILPAATSVTSIANLRANPRLALTLSHIPSHRTVQVKGHVLEIREGTEADLALATTYRELLAADLAFVGQPAGNTRQLGIWPCFAVDIRIAVVYAQTPGPSAGVQMPLGSGGQ